MISDYFPILVFIMILIGIGELLTTKKLSSLLGGTITIVFLILLFAIIKVAPTSTQSTLDYSYLTLVIVSTIGAIIGIIYWYERTYFLWIKPLLNFLFRKLNIKVVL